MSVRQIRTSYKYFGSDKNFALIINDDVATSIRNNTFSQVKIEDVSEDSFFSAISSYVGDISDFDFPIPMGLYDTEYAAYVSNFFRIYEVEGITGRTRLQQYFDYGNVNCDGSSYVGIGTTERRCSTEILFKTTSASSGYYSPLKNQFSFTDSDAVQAAPASKKIDLSLPIFKESDFIDDNKLKQFASGEYFSWIGITYDVANNRHRVTISGFRNYFSGTSLANFNMFYNEPAPEPPAPPPTDPYDPSHGGPGYSGTGGGPSPSGGTGTTGTGGLHDDSSDAIPTPSLPADATISSGLFTAYNPSASQLVSFANALWNMQPTDINDVLRFLFGGDAFNAIIGLHLLPVAPSTGGSTNIKLGNWDTNVSAPKINSQYKQVPFGSVLLPEYWGNCIDYAPYTKIQLALPYIGIVDVDTDDVLGSTNTLTYNIDVLSGAICATLHCVKFNLSSVIYQWSGACAVSLPFSGASYNSVLGAIAGIAAAGMGFASMAAGPIGAALPAAALAAGGGAFGAGSAASIMGTMKGKVQKSGSFGANSGALGIMTPYFILTRPVQSVPETWQADKGYPSNISAQLGTLTGYTEVSEINLECSGTEAEKNEIIDLLKKGVLF
jgi:hypothetical protein